MDIAGLEPVRVLYVDDDSTDARAVARGLERNRHGVSVETVETAAEGIERLDTTIDCVVSRQRLPESSGLELLAELRESWPELPFFLVADDGNEELAAEATLHDVTEYVPGRPSEANLDALEERITSAAREYRSRSGGRLAAATRGSSCGSSTTPSSGGSSAASSSDGSSAASSSGEAAPTAAGQLPVSDDVDPTMEWKSSLLDSIFDSIPVHLYVKDEAGRHVLVSNGFFDEPELFLGKRDVDLELVGDEKARETHREDLEVIETGEPIIDKEEHYPNLGQWNLTSKVPWYDEGGECIGLIGVSRNITERKRSQREVERQNERLEQFASVVSHDLRNPLSVASGRLDVALEECDSEHLEEVRWGLDRMDAIIEEVLALARHGQTVVEPGPVDLDGVVRKAWSSTRADGVTLETDDDLGTISGDERRITRLMENLFRNSVEHGSTADEGDDALTIRVGRLAGDRSGFYVEDDGAGIPPEERDAVFDPSYTTVEEGTGFGLSIVEQIADAHGWAVDLSASDAGGARFAFAGVDESDGA